EATRAYEGARERVRRFLGAREAREVVFARGATEAINLVARSVVRPGDEVVLTGLEHHSNIVPWQLAGATLRVVPLDDDGAVRWDALDGLLGPRTRVVAFAHVSNVTGAIAPAARAVARAHEAGALALIDGAQAAPHLPVDVAALGCDFYV